MCYVIGQNSFGGYLQSRMANAHTIVVGGEWALGVRASKRSVIKINPSYFTLQVKILELVVLEEERTPFGETALFVGKTGEVRDHMQSVRSGVPRQELLQVERVQPSPWVKCRSVQCLTKVQKLGDQNVQVIYVAIELPLAIVRGQGVNTSRDRTIEVVERF